MNVRPLWHRVARVSLVGAAVFAAISSVEVSTGSSARAIGDLGVGGMLSIAAWIAVGRRLRAGPKIAAGVGAGTGLVAVAISYALVQREHIPLTQLDGSSIHFVTAASFVVWPVLGAIVCVASDLTHRLKTDPDIRAATVGIFLVAAVAAFVTSLGLK